MSKEIRLTEHDKNMANDVKRYINIAKSILFETRENNAAGVGHDDIYKVAQIVAITEGLDYIGRNTGNQ